MNSSPHLRTIGRKVAALVALIVLLALSTILFSERLLSRLVTDSSAAPASYRAAVAAQELRYHVVQVQQYLSDISATRARDGLDDGLQKADSHARSFAETAADLQTLLDQTGSRDEAEQVSRLVVSFNSYHQKAQEMARAYITGGPEAGNPLMREVDGLAQQLAAQIDAHVRLRVDRGKAASEGIVARTQSVARILWGSIAVLLVVALAAGSLLIRAIVRPIRQVTETLALGTGETSTAARELAASSHSAAQRASQQAASLEETSAAMEQLASLIKRNAESAQGAKSLTHQTRSAAEAGACSTDEMQQIVERIQHAGVELTNAMAAMQQSNSEISQIIKTIDEIAFQTNILALNAAVEAARAGEAGMGFAVVADEVRSLAQKSADSARETAGKIEAALARSEHGATISADVMRQVELIAEHSSQVAGQLKGIVQQAHEVDTFVGQIAAASSEQSLGVADINRSIAAMNQLTQDGAASAEEIASSAQTLTAQAVSVTAAVGELRAMIDPQLPPAHEPANVDLIPAPPSRGRHGAGLRPFEPSEKVLQHN